MQPSFAVQNTLKQKLNANSLLFHPITGGSINKTYQVTAGDHKFFCKINSVKAFPELFIKERNGLEAIRNTRTIKVAEIIDCFQVEDQQVLILEWIKEGERSNEFWKNFGSRSQGTLKKY